MKSVSTPTGSLPFETAGDRVRFTVDEMCGYLPVTIGRHMGQEYEILSGVEEGETVVVKGQSTLRDGVKVNVL